MKPARRQLIHMASALASLVGCDTSRPAPESAAAPVASVARSASAAAAQSPPVPAATSSGALDAAQSASAPCSLGPQLDAEIEGECKRVQNEPLPAGHRPSPKQLLSLRGCDAEALYYGIGRARDFVAARECAHAQMEAKEAPVFGGEAILMMIYANGNGVRQNIDFAIKFACLLNGAIAETEARVSYLQTLRKRPSPREFDLCDHITSGLMSGHCTGHEERVNAVARHASKSEAIKRLPAVELQRLERAAGAFFDARERNEVDLSGTLRAAFQIAERGALEDDYVASLRKLGDLSFRPEADDFANADAELDKVYKKVMVNKSLDQDAELLPGAVKREGIRETQRVWLLYRDAWAGLGAKVRPDIPKQTWKAWVTRKRTKMLREFAHD